MTVWKPVHPKVRKQAVQVRQRWVEQNGDVIRSLHDAAQVLGPR